MPGPLESSQEEFMMLLVDKLEFDTRYHITKFKYGFTKEKIVYVQQWVNVSNFVTTLLGDPLPPPLSTCEVLA
jgi:hypothetical protein